MKIYILTRFAITNSNGWPYMLLSKSNLHKKNSWLFPESFHKAQGNGNIFNEQKLDQRIKIFNYITKPSIEAQTYQNYEWIFFISQDLPEKYKDILKRIKKSRCIIINTYKDIDREDYFDEEEYISIRLDDDDAIHPKYLENIKDFNKENEIVAPYHGKLFSLNEDKTIQAQNFANDYSIKSCGVGCYKKNIHSLGNHSSLHQRFPVNLVKDKNMFFISVGEHTSVNRIFQSNIEIKNYNIDTLFNE